MQPTDSNVARLAEALARLYGKSLEDLGLTEDDAAEFIKSYPDEKFAAEDLGHEHNLPRVLEYRGNIFKRFRPHTQVRYLN